MLAYRERKKRLIFRADYKRPERSSKRTQSETQRLVPACPEKNDKMWKKDETLWSKVGGSSVCSYRSVLMAPLGMCMAGLPHQ